MTGIENGAVKQSIGGEFYEGKQLYADGTLKSVKQGMGFNKRLLVFNEEGNSASYLDVKKKKFQHFCYQHTI